MEVFLLSLLFSFLIVGKVRTQNQTRCDEKVGDYCFNHVPSEMSWPDAEQTCRDDFDGHLISYHNQDEVNALQSFYYPGGYFLVGLNNIFATGLAGGIWQGDDENWIFTDGTAFDFENWLGGEPNNGGGSVIELCGRTTSAGGVINDVNCFDDERPSICKTKQCGNSSCKEHDPWKNVFYDPTFQNFPLGIYCNLTTGDPDHCPVQFQNCFGVNYTDPNVCSKRGTCVSLDKCECLVSGLTRANCTQFCFGREWDDPNVCEGFGECVNDNECNCTSGYHGVECQEKVGSCFLNQDLMRLEIEYSVPLDELQNKGFDASYYCWNFFRESNLFGSGHDLDLDKACLFVEVYTTLFVKLSNDYTLKIGDVVHMELIMDGSYVELSVEGTVDTVSGEPPNKSLVSVTLAVVIPISIVLIITLAVIVISVVALIVICTNNKRKKTGVEENVELEVIDGKMVTVSSAISKYVIDHKLVKIKKKLGSGGCGSVFTAEWENKTVALKIIPMVDLSDIEKFEKEARFMIECNHPNIVRLYRVFVRETQFGLVMELMEMGTLSDLLENKEKHLSWKDKWNIFYDLARVLKYLHQSKLCHRDVKPDNTFMFEKNGEIHAKIGDFGLAKALNVEKSHTMAIGSFKFMAPEMIGLDVGDDSHVVGKFPMEPVDVYALGMTVVAMLIGHDPYTGEAVAEMAIPSLVVSMKLRQDLPEGGPEVFKNLVNKCRAIKTSDRPTCEEIVGTLEDIKNEVVKYEE